jgi:hypothetical protein
MYLREIRRFDMGWIDLGQVRAQLRALGNLLMNPWMPWNVGKLLSNCTTESLSRRGLAP